MFHKSIGNKAISLALELYHAHYGDDAYRELMKLQTNKPAKCLRKMTKFMKANKEYLIRETRVDLMEESVMRSEI